MTNLSNPARTTAEQKAIDGALAERSDTFLTLDDCNGNVGRRVVLFLANGIQTEGKMLKPDDKGRCRIEQKMANGEMYTMHVPLSFVLMFVTGSLVDIVSVADIKHMPPPPGRGA